ncbi:MAG: SH3 domain-containing protein, partial [Lachnospiraceae bacterium]|nr:SH3 domain-containing protein [Lachnospiraceae bacterium]
MRENKSMGCRVKKAGKSGLRGLLPILLLFFIFTLTGCGSKPSETSTTEADPSATTGITKEQPAETQTNASGTPIVDVKIGSDPTGEASPYVETEGGETGATAEDPDRNTETSATAPEETKPEETTPAPEKLVAFENCSELVYATPRISLLNFREKPSTNGKILAKIPAGTPLQRTGRSDEWSRVIYEGTEGFVSADFVSLTAPVIDMFGEQAQVCDEEYYTTDKLNFREKPSKDGKVIKVLDRAATVRCTAFGENWSRIVIGD